MKKKYKLTGDAIVHFGHTLHRIRALRDIPRYNVKAGDLGGYIEKEDNLSHEGCSWVGDNAKVFNNAYACGNAYINENAWVHGNAEVSNNAYVGGNAEVLDNAKIYKNAHVQENVRVYNIARVFGNSHVFGNAELYDRAMVYGNAELFDDAKVFGNARVYQSAWVYGNAKVFGDAEVFSNVRLKRGAKIFDSNHYMVIGPIGSRDDYVTFYRTKGKTIWVNCGCFNGSVNEFLEKVDKTHGDNKHAKDYHMVVDLARNRINLD